ncbi:hypothetical protein HanOQP8_Chr16g0620101 [Helianthus annuus]|nr:hypothetical protein HanOQP8_Chr16g0620101 [Helianthus annuus]
MMTRSGSSFYSSSLVASSSFPVSAAKDAKDLIMDSYTSIPFRLSAGT